MYENNYANPHQSTLAELDDLLQLLADLNQEIELFAIGGTAMILQGVKEATKDIDFLTTLTPKDLIRSFSLAGLKHQDSTVPSIWRFGSTRVDVFYDEMIMDILLPDDWKKLSSLIKRVGKVSLYRLNWYDVIITKLARAQERDIDDIIAILKSVDVDLARLKRRMLSMDVKDGEYHLRLVEERL